MSETPIMGYSGWALVEQMGFRRTVGKVTEVEMYGTKMLRLDIPPPDGGEEGWTTRFCGGPSLYQVSPLSEAVALDQIKRQGDARPVRPTDYRLEDKRTDADNGGDIEDDDLAF
jgi:hypothetical protein